MGFSQSAPSTAGQWALIATDDSIWNSELSSIFRQQWRSFGAAIVMSLGFFTRVLPNICTTAMKYLKNASLMFKKQLWWNELDANADRSVRIVIDEFHQVSVPNWHVPSTHTHTYELKHKHLQNDQYHFTHFTSSTYTSFWTTVLARRRSQIFQHLKKKRKNKTQNVSLSKMIVIICLNRIFSLPSLFCRILIGSAVHECVLCVCECVYVPVRLIGLALCLWEDKCF